MNFDDYGLNVPRPSAYRKGHKSGRRKRRFFTAPKKCGRRRMIFIFSFLLAVIMLIVIINRQEIMWKIKAWNINSDSYSAVVETAKSQVNNSWQKYCKWWGTEERVEWCAIFVCWCAEKSGYTADKDYIYSSGANADIGMEDDSGAGAGDHARFHQKSGRYHSAKSDYIPQSGDFIYFDWDEDNYSEGNLVMDHIGIVEKVEHGVVFTIEGNSKGQTDETDLVRRKKYEMRDSRIRGYSSMK